MDTRTKEHIFELREKEKILEQEIESVKSKLENIRKEIADIYTQLKLNSDDIQCSYCGYIASKRENPDEAESYNDCIKKGKRWYCGNSECY
jgi:Holliday junction resolvase RusA-like endonuclease